MTGYSIDKLNIGDAETIEKTFTQDDVDKFGEVSLDMNPLHFDDSFASTTRFGKCIIHGFLSASLISAVIGMKLPGPGCIYLSQKLKFMKPVFVGDTIKATITVREINTEKNICTLDTICTNQDAETVVLGEAIVMPPVKV